MQCDLHRGPASPRYLIGFDLRRRPHLEADVLVIGGGVAGISAALAAAQAGKEVLLLVKGAIDESNTHFAQGGVAAVLGDGERADDDGTEKHVQDTLLAGAGLCDEAAVRDLLGDAERSIEFLRSHGCQFDRSADGHLALGREGGHSMRRILHAHGDSTGAEVARSLASAAFSHPLITVVEHAFAIDLLTTGQGADTRVVGVIYHRREELMTALAASTVLATGGCGWVWRETTNPPVATGDGLAMAYRAGAAIADLEFMQFHPTTLYIAGGARLLITEAMRGEGAVLKNQAGERFMARYHPDADLAPRDVVTRAILTEIRASGFPHVWLDATHLGTAFLQERFPTIAQACARLGIDIAHEWIPVHPSAHYQCGGILSDVNGATSLRGLWAAGEVGCTGLHGANRLASNSILEGLIVGMRAGRQTALSRAEVGRMRMQNPKGPAAAEGLDVQDLMRSLRSLMWRYVGMERSASDLAVARRSLAFWSAHQARGEFRGRDGWELQNLLLTSSIIATAAEMRSQSIGTHLRSDTRTAGVVDLRHHGFIRAEEP